MKDLGLEQFNIRSMFRAMPGHKFIVADYSGIELVILAAMSGDENLMDKVLQGDVHSYVANSLFGDVLIDKFGSLITKENKSIKGSPFVAIRSEFKKVSFGVVYGSTGFNLYKSCRLAMSRLGINLEQQECDRWVNDWLHVLFPNTGKLLNQNASYAITRGYTESVLGRRRRWDVRAIRESKWTLMAAMREGMNQPIQSSSADMTKSAMVELDSVLDPAKARILACIHDELLLEAKDEYVDEVSAITKEYMERVGYNLFPGIPMGSIVAEPKVSLVYDK